LITYLLEAGSTVKTKSVIRIELLFVAAATEPLAEITEVITKTKTVAVLIIFRLMPIGLVSATTKRILASEKPRLILAFIG
jgi:hypothetical protein